MNLYRQMTFMPSSQGGGRSLQRLVSTEAPVRCQRRLLHNTPPDRSEPPRRPQLREGDSLLFTNDDSIAEEQKADSSANLRASHFFLGAALA